MKKLALLTTVIFGLLFSTLSARSYYGGNVNVDIFFGALEPYGEWIEIGYDEYIWRPYKADYSWRPYSEGRWEWTKHGWYWVSYEPFGWATFHYGRWYHDDYYGWVWMPDNVWAPSWVEWRYNDHYIGWAPLPPYARFNHRHGIRFSINWHSGHHYWSFVKYNHFVSHKVYNYYVDRHYVKNVYRKTKHRTNYFADNDRIVNGGVNRRYVERKIGRTLNTKRISRTNDFKDFNSRDIKSRKGIVEYTPNERSKKQYNFDKRKIKKGRELKSLKSEKIAINKRKVEIKRKKDVSRSETKRVQPRSGKIAENKEKKSTKRGTVRKSESRSNKKKHDFTKPKKSEKKAKLNKSNSQKNEKYQKKNYSNKQNSNKKKSIKKSSDRNKKEIKRKNSSSSKKSYKKSAPQRSKKQSTTKISRA